MSLRAGAALAFLLVSSPASAAGELPDDAPVVGLSFRGANRAYPLALLAANPVLSDVIVREEIVLFHDAARGGTAAWFRSVHGEPIEFSGLAAGAVVDDVSTITRWDLTTGEAVAGNLAGQRLVGLPVTATSWGRWRETHPNAEAYVPRP